MTKALLDHAIAALLTDAESATQMIQGCRQKWGRHPMRNGKPIALDTAC